MIEKVIKKSIDRAGGADYTTKVQTSDLKRNLPVARQTISLGTPQQIRWLNGIIVAIVVMNLLDLLFTLAWARLGLMQEINILMEHLLHNSPFLFALVKIALVSLGLTLIWRYRRHPVSVVGLFSVFTVYYSVLLHHIRFASLFAVT